MLAMTAAGSGPIPSVQRFSQMLGIKQAELAKLIGVTEDALITNWGARDADRAILRIFTMASEMSGHESRAAIWFKHQPIPGWAGKTAYDLIGEGKADRVLDYLESVRSGIYA